MKHSFDAESEKTIIGIDSTTRYLYVKAWFWNVITALEVADIYNHGLANIE